jgi:hypothetical protein
MKDALEQRVDIILTDGSLSRVVIFKEKRGIRTGKFTGG